jgi:hypothetical protein
MAAASFADSAVTVVGFGTMGRHYVKALHALGVRRLRVCSRSAGRMEELRGLPGLTTVAGGIERLECRPHADELGIVATPTPFLVPAAERLAALGFRKLLIEKPVSLWSGQIEALADRLEAQGVDAVCAYNRLAYPSFHEVQARAAREGGITSCAYTFTELIKPDWPGRFPAVELGRWGIANSLHVVSMAHGLIGWPAMWNGHRAGSLAWHPAGTIFVGSGLSNRGVPFAYHADWGSTGRWSVEVHTAQASYRLCPLEKVFARATATADWREVPLAAFASDVKAGIAEQVAAMLDAGLRDCLALVSLRGAGALTRYAEDVFGYGADGERPGR